MNINPYARNIQEKSVLFQSSILVQYDMNRFHRHKGCFVLELSQMVKHEHQQHIEFMRQCRFLKILDGITFFCGNLETGASLFLELMKDFPVHLSVGEFMTGDPLHGDVVLCNINRLGRKY